MSPCCHSAPALPPQLPSVAPWGAFNDPPCPPPGWRQDVRARLCGHQRSFLSLSSPAELIWGGGQEKGREGFTCCSRNSRNISRRFPDTNAFYCSGISGNFCENSSRSGAVGTARSYLRPPPPTPELASPLPASKEPQKKNTTATFEEEEHVLKRRSPS